MSIFDFSDEKLREDFIHGNSFRELAHLDIDNRIPFGYQTLTIPEDLPLLKDGRRKTVVCTRLDWETNCGNLLNTFAWLKNNIPYHEVILITYGSYLSVPQQFIDSLPPNVVKWYAVNADSTGDRFTGIPLGIAKPIWENGQISTIIENRSEKKDKLLYINHNTETDKRTDRSGIRQGIYDRFRQEKGDWFTLKDQFGLCNLYGYDSMDELSEDFDLPLCPPEEKSSYVEGVKERGRRIFEEGSKEVGESTKNYIKEMSSHKFTIAPAGMGFDTMRTWEALYCKTIPILTDCNAMRHFEDLPVLYSEDFSEITEEYLNEKYEEFMGRDWDLSKMFISYWREDIERTYNGI